MFRKVMASALVVAAVAGASLAAGGSAQAGDGRNGAFAGGAAAGLVGGLLVGSALANRDHYYDDAPVYYEQPRCYFQRQRVPNEYDPGWHFERVRVCD